jgi:peroxin-3
MALLPSLGDQILEYMDVEAITRELQNRSKARNTRRQSQVSSSLASSIDVVQEHDLRSDSGSIAPSVASTGFSLDTDSAAAAAPQIVSQPSGPVQDPSVVASSTSSAISGENLSLHSSQLVRHGREFKMLRPAKVNAVRSVDDLLCRIRDLRYSNKSGIME